MIRDSTTLHLGHALIERTSLDEWVKAWGTTKGTTAIHEKLLHRYSEPHRHYHNLRHIDACLEEYAEVRGLIQKPFEVWLAIWFHDAVYDPKQKDNEGLSAQYAIENLGILERDSLELVSQLIIATKHDKQAASDDERYIMDIDLAILGKDRATFDGYEKSIRLEYEWVSEDRFREGRATILKGFLARPSIYQTEYFREKYEKTARSNLNRSISALLEEKWRPGEDSNF